MKILLVIALIFLADRYYFQLPEYKNKIVLKDSPVVVETNIKLMQALCQKLDHRGVTNFYVTANADSTLIVNNERFGRFAQVTAERLKGNSIFSKLSTKEIDQMLTAYKILNRNLVHAIFYDIGRKSWVFEYGYDVRYNEFVHQRDLFVIDDPAQLISPLFARYYTVVDRKENLVLVSLKDVRE